MKRELRGLRAILTGGTSGIGEALGAALSKAGVKLTVLSRNKEKLEANIRAWGGDCLAVPGDVTTHEGRTAAVEATVTKWGGLDLLINNAGIASWGHFRTSTETINRMVMETNYFGPTELIRIAIPHLMQGRQPAVVSISSMCGRRAMPAWPEYSASKFALCGFSEAIRAELAGMGVDVLLIVPGLTVSQLRENMPRNDGKADIDFQKGLPAADVAEKIITAITRNRRETVIGSDAKWMLRLNRWIPGLLDKIISRKVKKLYGSES